MHAGLGIFHVETSSAEVETGEFQILEQVGQILTRPCVFIIPAFGWLWPLVGQPGLHGEILSQEQIVRNCRISVKPSLKDAMDEWV